jgi:threonine dehydrogenase-like Zn-dependent dehydrogenase
MSGAETIRQVRSTDAGVTVTRTDPSTGPGVRVRITSSGICGSDLHLMSWGPLPIVLGHEFGGWLDDGTLVAVRPTVPCGACPACAVGAQQLCPTVTSQVYGTSLDGGLADEMLADPGCVFPIAPGVDPTIVGLVEPLAVAVHSANRTAATAGEHILVVGGGSIGLACAAVLIDRGHAVDVVARHPAQQRAATALGAGIEPGADYAAVVDAAGTTSSFRTCANRVRPGGQIVVPSMVWESVELPMMALVKEVTITPSMTYSEHEGVSEFATAADLLARRPEIAEALVTHRFGLDDAATAFETAADRSAGAIKVLVIP